MKENGLYYSHIHGSFTPVCTSEMIAFTRAHTYFKEINIEKGYIIVERPEYI